MQFWTKVDAPIEALRSAAYVQQLTRAPARADDRSVWPRLCL